MPLKQENWVILVSSKTMRCSIRRSTLYLRRIIKRWNEKIWSTSSFVSTVMRNCARQHFLSFIRLGSSGSSKCQDLHKLIYRKRYFRRKWIAYTKPKCLQLSQRSTTTYSWSNVLWLEKTSMTRMKFIW